MAQAVTLGEIFEETRELIARHGVLLAGVLAAIAGGYVALDWIAVQDEANSGLNLLATIAGLVVSIFVQYAVTERLLADRRPEGQPAPMRRYGTLFGAGLLSGAAIACAAVLLVLPGIYLAGRWFTYAAQIVENRHGASQSLRASWSDSENSQLAFGLAALLSFAPAILMFGALFGLQSEFLMSNSIAALAIVNVMSALTSLAGWTLGVAAYRRAAPVDRGLGAVFD